MYSTMAWFYVIISFAEALGSHKLRQDNYTNWPDYWKLSCVPDHVVVVSSQTESLE